MARRRLSAAAPSARVRASRAYRVASWTCAASTATAERIVELPATAAAAGIARRELAATPGLAGELGYKVLLLVQRADRRVRRRRRAAARERAAPVDRRRARARADHRRRRRPARQRRRAAALARDARRSAATGCRSSTAWPTPGAPRATAATRSGSSCRGKPVRAARPGLTSPALAPPTWLPFAATDGARPDHPERRPARQRRRADRRARVPLRRDDRQPRARHPGAALRLGRARVVGARRRLGRRARRRRPRALPRPAALARRSSPG